MGLEDTLKEGGSQAAEPVPAKVVWGAGAAGVIVGWLLKGPFVGAGLGVGGAAAAGLQPPGSVTGDIARSVGQLTVNGYEHVRDFERQHNIVNRVKRASWRGVAKARELNEEHKILDRGREGVADVLHKAKEFDDKYKVREKAAHTILEGLKTVNEVLEPTEKPDAKEPDWQGGKVEL